MRRVTMRPRHYFSLAALVFACAAALGGCATHGTPSESDAKKNEFRGYEKIVRDGQTFYCQTQTVTGSLFDRKACFTKEQLDQQADNIKRIQQDSRQTAVARPGPPQ